MSLLFPVPARALILVVAAVAISGCATTQSGAVPKTKESVVITLPPLSSDLKHKPIPLAEANDTNPSNILSGKLVVMALFAQTSYRAEIQNAKDREIFACNYLMDTDGTHRDIRYQMPRESNETGWERWVNSGACYSGHGLFFETYIHKSQNRGVDEAVIGIRGTDSLLDLETNISGAFPTQDNEYLEAKRLIPPVIAALKRQFGQSIKIYLTGHSLGGGLAQEIAYLTDKNDLVATYAFNSSPVTHWMQLSAAERKNDAPVIHRAYLNGEILQYLRKIAKPFISASYSRIDYEFNFYRGEKIETHSMSHLLCNFASRVQKHGGAEHGYTITNASETLSDPVLCPEAIMEQDIRVSRLEENPAATTFSQ